MKLRIFKILVSTSLIVALIWHVDWDDLESSFSSMDSATIFIAVLLLLLQFPVSAWKWQKSLRLHGLQFPFLFLLRILCIAFFFNNFLPTAIGGDAYRAYRTMNRPERRAFTISTVIVERLVGLAALLFFGYVSAIYLIYFGTLAHAHIVSLAVLAATAAGLVGLVLWLIGAPSKILTAFHNSPRLEPLYASMRVVATNRRHFVGLIGLSLLFQALAIVTIATVFDALGLPGKFFESGFTAAAAGIAGVLPVSINGIGVVEGSFVAAAWESGLPYSSAVVAALFLRAFMLIASVSFGILYAIEPGDKSIVRTQSKL